jgi:ATP-dependent RNA helicase DDX5/DBP2
VDAQKVDRLCELLLEEKAEAEKFGGALPMTIVFVERKARADEIMELLNAEGVTAAAFHGGRSQGEREAALEDYKTGRCSVLVATDVAARGLGRERHRARRQPRLALARLKITSTASAAPAAPG